MIRGLPVRASEPLEAAELEPRPAEDTSASAGPVSAESVTEELRVENEENIRPPLEDAFLSLMRGSSQ